MPLPKPPAKKAALLSNADLDAQAAPRKATRSNKPEPASPALLDLFDPTEKTPAHTKPAVVRTPPPPAPVVPHAHARPKRPRHDGPPKLFVLDTNVLMHDPMSIYRFDEHDIYLPMITLEELDS